MGNGITQSGFPITDDLLFSSSLVGKIRQGTHMHIMPWSYPQLFLYLKLAGYANIKLHNVPEKKPKHFHERIISLPQKFYCNNKHKKASSDEEKAFWNDAGTDQSLFGRRLVVSAETSQNRGHKIHKI